MRRLSMSSSDSTVSSRPNSFIKARSLALLIFMRSGLTFSVVSATGSPTRSSSTSDMSSSPSGLAALLGLRPRLAPVAAGAPSAAGFFGGRPGFFFAGAAAASRASAAAVSLAWVDLAGTAGTFFRGLSDSGDFADFGLAVTDMAVFPGFSTLALLADGLTDALTAALTGGLTTGRATAWTVD